MFKRLSALIAVVLTLALLLAACATNEAPKPTEAPQETPTTAPTEEPTPTPEPEVTEEPTPTPTPKPKINYEGPAFICDLEDDTLIAESACTYEYGTEGPWLKIVTEQGDNNIVFRFGDTLYTEDTPIFAFKYRIGYGQSVRGTNHFYAIATKGGPVPQVGMYNDIDFVTDLEWHIGVFNLDEAFPEAEGEWVGMRFPTVDTVGGDFAIAWIGLFESEEDVAAYDAAFNEVYGEKLVKAEKPKVEKKEAMPEKLVDSFEDTVFDFSDCESGDALMNYESMEWLPALGTRASTFVEVDGNVMLNLTFDAWVHDSLVEAGKGFTAKFDFMNKGAIGGNFGGFIFGWGDENNSGRDFYENSYGKDGVNSLVGKSGIGFDFRGGNKLYIYICQWNSETSKRDVAGVDIETAVDFDAKMVSFVIDDDGTSKITVTADGVLICTITYGDAGLLDDAVGYNEKYFRSVSITDGEGNEIVKSENALFSVYDSFAFGARARNLLIDNIDIKTK